MALTQKQISDIRSKYGIVPVYAPTKTSALANLEPTFFSRVGSDLKKRGSDILSTMQEPEGVKETAQDVEQTTNAIKGTIAQTKGKISNIAEASISGGENKLTAFLKTAGIIAGGISQGLGDLFTGAVKYVLPKKSEDYIKEKIKNTIENGSISDSKWAKEFGSSVSVFKENYNNLPDKDKRTIDALLGASRFAFDLATAGTTKKITEAGAERTARLAQEAATKTSQAISDSATSIKKGIENAGGSIADTELFKGVKQLGTELAERLPRAVDRLKESSAAAADRAVRISQSNPVVAEALKTSLDSRFINTVADADVVTRKAFKKVLDIAEETPKTLALKKQPSIVSGELAAKQFELISKEKNSVGKQIGDNIKLLSKNEQIPLDDSLNQIDSILQNQGIKLVKTKKGFKLNFSGSKFSPSERTKIQELYSLATEGGNNLTPAQIHGKDQLFSKLQREAKMEGVGNIIIDTGEGEKNLFSVFRDIYSKKLDTISPEIGALNKQYRNLSLVTEDIEDSILKTPNFNAVKSTDPAEFAKVNLRRIFGESGSSPAFEAVADEMDALARKLGYTDARPKDVAEFAQALRALYPESIPKTGFSGGVSVGIKDLLSKVVSAGAPNAQDQRRALKNLLEQSIK